jgi:hypothetical protein
MPRRTGPSVAPANVLSLLRTVVGELDELIDALERIDPGSHWSAERWSTASMAFRMRLAAAEHQLRQLRQIDPADWPDTGWALDLSDAGAKLEQRLHAVVTLLSVLVSHGIPVAERAWETRRFVMKGRELLESLRRLRAVIVERHPEAAAPAARPNGA